MKFAHDGGEVGGILKKTDGRDAGGPGRKAGGSVRESDAADGEDRDRHRMADFGETNESLRRAEDCFGRSGEHGTEENVVCAGRGRALGGLQRVARDANQKVRRSFPGGLIGAEQTLRFFDRQGIATQMDAASLFSKSHVQAVIYKNARCG